MKKSELRQIIRKTIKEQLGSAGPRPMGPGGMPPKWFYSRFNTAGDVQNYLKLGIQKGLRGDLLNQAQSQLERPIKPDTPVGTEPKRWFSAFVGLLTLAWKIYVYGAEQDPPWWD